MVEALWPVYCPTKSRAGRVTPEVLSLAPILVLEPLQRAPYARAYAELAQRRLSQAGKGVAYARNGLMVAARNDGCEWCWMVDDDVSDFHRRREGVEPLPLSPKDALLQAQAIIGRYKRIALAGLPVAWARVGEDKDEMRSPDRVRAGVNCYCVVALHLPSLIGLTYREELPLREDTDFSLQVLARGLMTLRCDDLAYHMPICGTGSGGLAGVYAQPDAHPRSNARLAEIWPGIVKTGGDCKHYWCDWRKAAGAPGRKPVPLWSISKDEEETQDPQAQTLPSTSTATSPAFAIPHTDAG